MSALPTAYLVLASQRSGSTLLVESLRSTGVAGEPQEFFQYLPTTSQSPQPRQWFEGGLYENTYRKVDGVWRIHILNYCPQWHADFETGWAHTRPNYVPFLDTIYPEDPSGPDLLKADVWLWPTHKVVPFHNVHPVTGEPQFKAFGAEFPTFSYFDLAGTWNPTDDIQVRLGINNILDKGPPLGTVEVVGGGAANTYSTYEIMGRQLFLSMTARFGGR